jgi:hypothetical protein
MWGSMKVGRGTYTQKILGTAAANRRSHATSFVSVYVVMFTKMVQYNSFNLAQASDYQIFWFIKQYLFGLKFL